MKRTLAAVAVGACVWAGVCWNASAERTAESQAALTQPPAARAAELRSRGADGLEQLLAEYDALPADDARRAALRDLIDQVAGQRYGWASRLYWHTDFGEAQRAARAEGKPILSLRLLGRLTDEYSCANSRFFRTALYANEQISATMRDQFVLHWSSERPAPVLTVDFGDGRVMRRTVTGNSIHYLLDDQGQPLDALPGMHGPGAFLEWLEQSAQLWEAIGSEPPEGRPALVELVHRRRLSELAGHWQRDIARLGRPPFAAAPSGVSALKGRPEAPPAEKAVAVALPKRAVEAPLIPPLTMSGQPAENIQDEELWRQLAALHAEECQLDEASRALIGWQQPLPADDGEAAASTDALQKMLDKFQADIALDTVRNRYILQRRIREWLVGGEALSLQQLNSRVYSELFLTPRTDPWIGLLPADTYSGLQHAGVSGPHSKLAGERASDDT